MQRLPAESVSAAWHNGGQEAQPDPLCNGQPSGLSVQLPRPCQAEAPALALQQPQADEQLQRQQLHQRRQDETQEHPASEPAAQQQKQQLPQQPQQHAEGTTSASRQAQQPAEQSAFERPPLDATEAEQLPALQQLRQEQHPHLPMVEAVAYAAATTAHQPPPLRSAPRELAKVLEDATFEAAPLVVRGSRAARSQVAS